VRRAVRPPRSSPRTTRSQRSARSPARYEENNHKTIPKSSSALSYAAICSPSDCASLAAPATHRSPRTPASAKRGHRHQLERNFEDFPRPMHRSQRSGRRSLFCLPPDGGLEPRSFSALRGPSTVSGERCACAARRTSAPMFQAGRGGTGRGGPLSCRPRSHRSSARPWICRAARAGAAASAHGLHSSTSRCALEAHDLSRALGIDPRAVGRPLSRISASEQTSRAWSTSQPPAEHAVPKSDGFWVMVRPRLDRDHPSFMSTSPTSALRRHARAV